MRNAMTPHQLNRSTKLIILVVNKWWELDPILSVFLENLPEAKPQLERHPRARPNQNALPPEELEPKPRAVFSFMNVRLEMWCIADLLEHVSTTGSLHSSTQMKALQLPKIFNGRDYDLVIALGTGASIGPDSLNGSVVVGTKVFMHNAHPNRDNPNSDWGDGPFDCVVDSSFDPALFSGATRFGEAEVINRFLPVPNGFFPKIVIDYNAVALNTINVTDHREYEVLDAVTVNAFINANSPFLGRSIETTHGLIRIYGGPSFISITAITNRLGHFKGEASSAQKTAAAHNAGVVAAQIISNITKL